MYSLVSHISVTLQAKVNTISGNFVDVRAEQLIQFEMDRLNSISSRFNLKRTYDNNYQIQVFGKNGEPTSGCKVKLWLKHLFQIRVIDVELQTDDNGIIELGELQHIQSIQLYPSVGRMHEIWNSETAELRKWVLNEDNFSTLPPAICAAENTEIKVPCNTAFSDALYSIYSFGLNGLVLEDLETYNPLLTALHCFFLVKS